MAATRSDGLGTLDRLVILVAWLASCGVVFVIGYYVGKDAVPPPTTLAPSAIEVPIVGVPVAPGPQAGTSFYDSLGRQGTSGDGPPGTLAPMRPTTTAPPVAPAPSPTTTVAPAPPSTRPAVVPPAVGATTTTRPPAPPPTVPATGGRGWTVYVSPTRDRFEAERQRTALRTAGYDASVVRMQRDGDIWYRVRAGRFDSEATAERVRRDLRDRGIGHAFVHAD